MKGLASSVSNKASILCPVTELTERWYVGKQQMITQIPHFLSKSMRTNFRVLYTEHGFYDYSNTCSCLGSRL